MVPSFPGHPRGLAAAFDTKAHGKAMFTGRASKAIGHCLRRLGLHVVGTKSFLVDGQGRLDDGEVERAKVWGASLATVASVSPAGRVAA